MPLNCLLFRTGGRQAGRTLTGGIKENRHVVLWVRQISRTDKWETGATEQRVICGGGYGCFQFSVENGRLDWVYLGEDICRKRQK